MYDSNLPYASTPDLINQYGTLHLARVVKVGDPEGRGRVRVECAGLLGTGEKNWTSWIEVAGNGTTGKGRGTWNPLKKDDMVLVGFLSGDPMAMYCIPGPPTQNGKGNDKSNIPDEAKALHQQDPLKATRIMQIKSESGAGIMIDDNGGQETMSITDWTGAGWFSIAPGKTKDKAEQPNQESLLRSGSVRGIKTAFAQDGYGPGDIEGGTAMSGFVDQNGNGILNVSSNGSSTQVIQCGGEGGPSVVLDNDNNRIIFTAGSAQLVVDGNSGMIKGTSALIQNQEPVDTTGGISGLWQSLKNRFKQYGETA